LNKITIVLKGGSDYVARLTKDKRDAIRDISANHEPTDIRDTPLWSWVDDLLNDIDAADEEILRMHDCADENTSLRDANDRLRTLARRLYGRAIEGDEFTDNDFAELRSFSLIDDDGLPAYDDEEVDL
jgi:hypothetical protein